MFKFILAVIGYYFWGIFAAILGYFIGGSIDRARALGLGAVNPLGNAQRQAVFLETTFVLMGKLAKADGRISQEEIDHVEDLMQKMGMTAMHRQQAIAQFKRGSAPDFDIEETLQQFMSTCGHTLHLKQVLMMYLIVMATADGLVDDAEHAFLSTVAIRLGYQEHEFRQMLEMVLNQSHFRQGSGQATSSTALADAYKALGVSETDSDATIKRAYRKLMSQYHPDKLMGQGVPEDMLAVATEQAKEIQIAYDLIKKHRDN